MARADNVSIAQFLSVLKVGASLDIVRVTKLNQLARHRNVDHKVCDNTGVPKMNPEKGNDA